MLETNEEMGAAIKQYSKSIAQIPYKRGKKMSGFNLFMDETRGIRVGKDGSGLVDVWRNQLMNVYKGVSAEMANAIMAEYPNPKILWKAYQDCTTSKEGE